MSVAGTVIQANGRPDFEDGSRTGSTMEVKCDYHSISTKPEVNTARCLMQAVILGVVCPLGGYCSRQKCLRQSIVGFSSSDGTKVKQAVSRAEPSELMEAVVLGKDWPRS